MSGISGSWRYDEIYSSCSYRSEAITLISSSMSGYSKTPLTKKLGIKDGFKVLFINPPDNFINYLDINPSNIMSALDGELDYIHIFSKDLNELEGIFTKALKYLNKKGIIWISWPKAGKLGTNLNENIVRETGLKLNVVDVKVAAIDDTWSGLKFVYRIKDR